MRANDYQKRRDRLRSLGLLGYQDYLGSEEWQTRRFVYELDNRKRCSFCGSTEQIDLHHRSYERLGHEVDEDLLWLCRDHHQEYHDTGQMPVKPTEQQIEALEDIGCTAEAIRVLSQRQAGRKIRAAQDRLLRQQRDADDDWLCTDANTKTWIERN